MKLKNVSITKQMQHDNVAGLSIALLERGQISDLASYGVLEAGTEQNVTNDSIFHACSMSKWVTAYAVMLLCEQGVLHLDEDVNKRLVNWKVRENDFTKNKKVTLRALLSHQAGIIDPDGAFGVLETKEIPTMVELLEGRTDYCPEAIEIKYEPTSEFQYADAGFCIIEQLIEDVTGKHFEEVMQELVFEPLKMKNSTYQLLSDRTFSCGHNSDGKVVEGKYPTYPYPAACGLWTTPNDLARLLSELIFALKGESKTGLSKINAKEMITAQGKPWTGLGIFLDGTGQNLEISSLGWGIGFQCMLIAYPYLESGAIIMTNTDVGKHQLEGVIGEIYRAIDFLG
ncbi:beta-lactamase family protein [Caldibacillus lycopersici]|uniref:Beta-lactamase family protein n=1 Tax=Perspicuibacillus lycopersici TaxID=1325689 RepID=A0AAE3ITK5_9BACI|nr:serine hydrolase domain-containing protein [Perspicuibacillus lycopersici]MCU9613221.1 beta-lactamase family protein [Perspicuibacillus lycopersici]